MHARALCGLVIHPHSPTGALSHARSVGERRLPPAVPLSANVDPAARFEGGAQLLADEPLDETGGVGRPRRESAFNHQGRQLHRAPALVRAAQGDCQVHDVRLRALAVGDVHQVLGLSAVALGFGGFGGFGVSELALLKLAKRRAAGRPKRGKQGGPSRFAAVSARAFARAFARVLVRFSCALARSSS